jgi:hypothetical protein
MVADNPAYSLTTHTSQIQIQNVTVKSICSLHNLTSFLVTFSDQFSTVSVMQPQGKWKYDRRLFQSISLENLSCLTKAEFRTRLRFEPAVLQTEAYIIIAAPMCPVQGLSRVSLWKGTANQNGTRGSVVGWGTTLQAARSRVRFPMRSLDLSDNLILLAAQWPWGRLSL